MHNKNVRTRSGPRGSSLNNLFLCVLLFCKSRGINMHDKFINAALKEAKKAYKKNEVPVGAIIVKNNKILAKSHNLVEKKEDATAHAELIAIKKASKLLKNWRLNDCEMYVTLEPCNMCVSAIELCRIKKVYFLVKRNKDIKKSEEKYVFLNNSDEPLKLIQDFFKKRR